MWMPTDLDVYCEDAMSFARMKRLLRRARFGLESSFAFKLYKSKKVIDVCTFVKDGFLTIQLIQCTSVATAIREFDFSFLKNALFFSQEERFVFIYDLNSILRMECYVDESEYFDEEGKLIPRQKLRLEKYSSRGFKFLKFSKLNLN